MMQMGYILLYRSLLSWEHWMNKITAHVYLHLLLQAEFKYDYKKGTEAGDVDITIPQIADDINADEQQVRRALKRLQQSGNIIKVEIKANINRYKIVNYTERQYEQGVNWIIFPRSLCTLPIYKNTNTFLIFVNLLLSADNIKGTVTTNYNRLSRK